MSYNKFYYNSPIGKITLCSNEESLIGLWFDNQKYYGAKINLREAPLNQNAPITEAIFWLDQYFKGNNPDLSRLNLNPIGTPFQKKVWKIMLQIPYGETSTYNCIAKKLDNYNKMTPRAVGNAVSRNPISIIIPCHRVLGHNGKLIGYAAGVEKKQFLLNFERNLKEYKI